MGGELAGADVGDPAIGQRHVGLQDFAGVDVYDARATDEAIGRGVAARYGYQVLAVGHWLDCRIGPPRFDLDCGI